MINSLNLQTKNISLIVSNFSNSNYNEVNSNFNWEEEIKVNKSLNDLYKLTENTINTISQKGFLFLIGIRCTNKSLFELPPRRDHLLSQFNKPVSEKSKLSCGARAVMKHCDRNSNHKKYWGKISGNEYTRNNNSNLICMEILANASWINIFELNSTNKIVEVRDDEGHGLRWDYINYKMCTFKGLVEPQFESRRKEEEIVNIKKQSSEDLKLRKTNSNRSSSSLDSDE